MPRQEVHIGDIGSTFICTIEEDGTVVDLATATDLKIYMKTPTETKTFDASLYTDGTDGKIKYVTVEGDIDLAGEWQIQAGANIGGWQGRSSVEKFEVYANL